MATGYGYGKVILFGEHFVVHGNHTIASGISRRTVAELRPGTGQGFRIIDSRPAADGYKEKYLEAQRESVELMNDNIWHLDFDRNPVEVELAGDLYCASGVGASAASCVAMARAVSEHFGLGLGDADINRCGLEGDRAYARNPSGIDNTCSTYGGLVLFRKHIPEKGIEGVMERPAVGKPLEILMVSTGITTRTEDAIQVVKDHMAEFPEASARIFSEAEDIVMEAGKALEAGDLRRTGELMDRNHELLQEVGVSCPELDHLVEMTRECGALGAKMTGGGLGGFMVALAPDADTRDRIAGICEAEGFRSIAARIS